MVVVVPVANQKEKAELSPPSVSMRAERTGGCVIARWVPMKSPRPEPSTANRLSMAAKDLSGVGKSRTFTRATAL